MRVVVYEGQQQRRAGRVTQAVTAGETDLKDTDIIQYDEEDLRHADLKKR